MPSESGFARFPEWKPRSTQAAHSPFTGLKLSITHNKESAVCRAGGPVALAICRYCGETFWLRLAPKLPPPRKAPMNPARFQPPPEIASLLAGTGTEALLVDSAMNVRWFTPGMKEHCGKVEKNSGTSLENILSGFSYPDLISHLQLVMETGQPMQTRIVGSSLTPCRCTLAPFAIPGETDGVLLSLVDLGLPEATGQGDDVRDGLRNVVFAAATNGIITLDANGVITDLNPAMERILGIEAPGLRGTTLAQQRLGGGPGKSFYDTVAAVVSQKTPGQPASPVKVRGTRPDGTTFVCELTWSLVGEGSGCKYAFILSDIGRTVFAEQEAAARRRLFDATVGNAAVGISVVDIFGNWLMVNDRMCEMLRYSRPELMAMSPWQVTHPDDVETSRREFGRLVQGEIDSYQIEKRYLRRDGSIFWGLVTATRQKDQRGNSVRNIAIIQDISKSKSLEQDLRTALRAREQFLATLSHELRNPLSAMLNASLLLKDQSATDSQEHDEAVSVIRGNIRLIGGMLEDLLDLSRFTNAKIRLRDEVCLFGELVRESVENTRHGIEARGQSVQVEGLSEHCFVFGDRGRLQQAIGNLLVNASKYSPSGGIILCRAEHDASSVRLHVIDSGAGIPEECLEDIFEPFFQVEQTIDRSSGGMGLGLPLVRMIARSHGGEIVAYSAGPGTGSEFVLSLPVGDPAESEELDHENWNCAGLSIMVVDDHPAIRMMLGRLIKLRGFAVEIAANSTESLEKLGEAIPDVMLIDIGLPDLNGYELAARIRQRPEGEQIILVAMTGYGQPGDRNRSAAAGFDHHLVKPVDVDDILPVLQDLWVSRRRQMGPATPGPQI